MLEAQGVSRSALITALGRAATINGKDTSYSCVDWYTAAELVGQRNIRQNLVDWLVEPTIANGLRWAP